MGLIFSAQFNNVAVTAAQDLFELNAPSTGPVVVHRCIITQTSDFGDAQSEILRILAIRGYTTSGSGGSAPTAVDLGLTAATFGGTVEANNTTAASAGSPVTLHAEGWNVAGAFDYLPTPETRIWVPASGRLVFNLPSAPADSLTMSGTLIFEVV